ncbi:MAG: hypothetical protein WC516_02900 [Patescibacteria group bacterium]
MLNAATLFTVGISDLYPAILVDYLVAIARQIPNMPQDREAIERGIDKYWNDQDHGHPHAVQVYTRALEIMRQSPLLLSCIHSCRTGCAQGIGPIELEQIMVWSSQLHDLGRSAFGISVKDHELFGAEVATTLFNGVLLGSDALVQLRLALLRHDYMCLRVDGEGLPSIFMSSPIAEIFRLADKTSCPVEGEIRRYYATGKKCGTPFFNPKIPDEVRFSFGGDRKDWDEIMWIMFILSMSPEDFFFGETRDLYREWARQKSGAIQIILSIAQHQEKLDSMQLGVIGVMLQDFRKFCGL